MLNSGAQPTSQNQVSVHIKSQSKYVSAQMESQDYKRTNAKGNYDLNNNGF